MFRLVALGEGERREEGEGTMVMTRAQRSLSAFAAAAVVLGCTLGVAYSGRRRTAAGFHHNELLQLVGGRQQLLGGAGGRAAPLVRLKCCSYGAGSSIPAPYDYFTTPDSYDGVPYSVLPRPQYDHDTLEDMEFLGKFGDAGVPLGYSGSPAAHFSGPPAAAAAGAGQSLLGGTAVVGALQAERRARGGMAGADAVLGYRVLRVYSHDTAAFTQGLEYVPHRGAFLESTGQWGESQLREVDVDTGKVLRRVPLSREFFGEGCTELNGRVYQLTWKEKTCLVYDATTFEPLGRMHYQTEGWGVSNDGVHLITSDGTPKLAFRDPETFEELRSVDVHEAAGGEVLPVRNVNELEYVRGEVWANVWHTDRIARINPADGRVLGWIDLAGINPAGGKPPPGMAGEDVLNGIAWDESRDRLWVTGKTWGKLFEIELVRK